MHYDADVPAEGALYRELNVAGHNFELRYGYYEESERRHCPPVVVYPNLQATPLYSPEGNPLVTQVQDICEHGRAPDGEEAHWCSDCIYFSGEHPEIGICRCIHRRKETSAGGT